MSQILNVRWILRPGDKSDPKEHVAPISETVIPHNCRSRLLKNGYPGGFPGMILSSEVQSAVDSQIFNI